MNAYSALIRGNRNFRYLWLGQIVSQMGDWFAVIAAYALLLDLTGSATAVAWMIIVQFLPMALIGPGAGVIVDRFNRRRLMIVADVARGVSVLGLLLVNEPGDVWIAYVAMAAKVSGTAFFEPARTSAIPAITSRSELLVANALSSATWAAMLAVGAAIGGVVTATAGREAAFILNSAAFFLSAALIAQTRFAADPPVAVRARSFASSTGLTDLAEAFGYVRSRTPVAALILVKAGWGIAGGVLLLLTIFGERVVPVAGSAAVGIGILYAARGVGAGLGPILARALLGEAPRTLRKLIGPSFFAVAFFHLALAVSPGITTASLAVVGAAMGGSVLWVFSTVLLQIEVPDRFRGRVFAAELALMTLSASISSYLTAYALDGLQWSPRAASAVLAAVFCLPGIAWIAVSARWPEPPDTVYETLEHQDDRPGTAEGPFPAGPAR
jgi:MFS family permease